MIVRAKKNISGKNITLYAGNLYEVCNESEAKPYNKGIIAFGWDRIPNDAKTGVILDETGHYKKVLLRRDIFEDATSEAENDVYAEMFGIA